MMSCRPVFGGIRPGNRTRTDNISYENDISYEDKVFEEETFLTKKCLTGTLSE